MSKHLIHLKNPVNWCWGALAAFIGGGATSIVAIYVAPESFNFSTHFGNLVEIFVGSGLINLAMYLKKSPLPEIVDEEEGADNSIGKD
jgi:hypothetical protein